jgi:hypothetical protein
VTSLTSEKSQPLVVYRLDASSGSVLSRYTASFAIGAAVTAVTPAGVWFSYRTGMNGGTIILNAQTLAAFKPPGTLLPRNPLPSLYGGFDGGTWVTALGGEVWLTTATGISCVSSATGAVQAGAYFRLASSGSYQSLQPFAVIDHRLFATAALTSGTDLTGVVAVSPPGACF